MRKRKKIAAVNIDKLAQQAANKSQGINKVVSSARQAAMRSYGVRNQYKYKEVKVTLNRKIISDIRIHDH